jgi:hypothetical protein
VGLGGRGGGRRWGSHGGRGGGEEELVGEGLPGEQEVRELLGWLDWTEKGRREGSTGTGTHRRGGNGGEVVPVEVRPREVA